MTGCPSLSSSEEEEEEEDYKFANQVDEPLELQQSYNLDRDFDSHQLRRRSKGASYQQQQQQQSGGRTSTSAATSRSQLNLSGGGAPANQGAASPSSPVSRMNHPHHNQQHRYSDHEAYLLDQSAQEAGGRASAASASRPSSRQQHFQLPTSINITAPSPMGSVRDMSSRSSADSHLIESQLMFSPANKQASGQQQTTRKQQQQQQQDERNLANMASQLSLGQMGAATTTAPGSRANQADRSGQHGALVPQEASSDAANDKDEQQQEEGKSVDDKSRSQLIDELLRSINDESFNEYIDFNNKLAAATRAQSQQASGQSEQLFDQRQRPRSAMDGQQQQTSPRNQATSPSGRPRTLNLASTAQSASTAALRSAAGRSSMCITSSQPQQQQQGSTFDNVLRRMSTNLVQNFASKMNSSTLGATNIANDPSTATTATQITYTRGCSPGATNSSDNNLRREKSSTSTYANSLYVDNQVPARRHSDNTINVPRIQVALSSPQASGSRTNLNQRASVSASKLANKWKTTAKTNQREAGDKLSPNLGGALSYMRRHSSGNTTDKNNNQSDQNQSNGLGAQLLNVSPFKVSSLTLDIYLGHLLDYILTTVKYVTTLRRASIEEAGGKK